MVNTREDECAREGRGCGDYTVVINSSWRGGNCGAGATKSCNELQCTTGTMTPMQECALNQAYDLGCALRSGGMVTGEYEGCPSTKCEWYLTVVDQGCPQEVFPFNC